MEFLSQLWMPIVVSSVFVFIASYLTHMVLPHHKGEWKALPKEDAVLDTLRGVAPGNYMIPFCSSMEEMKDPAFLAKQKQGPNGTIVLWDGAVNMGRNLGLTFLSYMVIAVFVAYVAWHSLGPGPHEYLRLFRIAGACAFMAHGMALVPQAIWYKGIRVWACLLDALLYALLLAGTFGWLWPKT